VAVSAHRLHALDIPPVGEKPVPPPSREIRDPGHPLLPFAALFIVVATVIAGIVALAINGAPPEVRPVKQPQASTTPLPSAEALHAQRLTSERLRDWRAGYEAAVQNGCKVQPLLSAPVGAKP
jgi:hypothetical protein